jgi:hypothetical protein
MKTSFSGEGSGPVRFLNRLLPPPIGIARVVEDEIELDASPTPWNWASECVLEFASFPFIDHRGSETGSLNGLAAADPPSYLPPSFIFTSANCFAVRGMTTPFPLFSAFRENVGGGRWEAHEKFSLPSS